MISRRQRLHRRLSLSELQLRNWPRRRVTPLLLPPPRPSPTVLPRKRLMPPQPKLLRPKLKQSADVNRTKPTRPPEKKKRPVLHKRKKMLKRPKPKPKDFVLRKKQKQRLQLLPLRNKRRLRLKEYAKRRRKLLQKLREYAKKKRMLPLRPPPPKRNKDSKKRKKLPKRRSRKRKQRLPKLLPQPRLPPKTRQVRMPRAKVKRMSQPQLSPWAWLAPWELHLLLKLAARKIRTRKIRRRSEDSPINSPIKRKRN